MQDQQEATSVIWTTERLDRFGGIVLVIRNQTYTAGQIYFHDSEKHWADKWERLVEKMNQPDDPQKK